MRILLVGAGGIAPEYVKALRALGHEDISVLSRSEQSAGRLAESLGLSASFGGGTERLAQVADQFDAAILATNIESLVPLIEAWNGTAPGRPLLVEKPVALASAELEALAGRVAVDNMTVALNRLYFPSVAALRERLVNERATSAHFSFTEWVHRIDPTRFGERELARWGLSNCIHVIATTFDLIGLPRQLDAQVAGRGRIDWHPQGSVFSGSGVAGDDVCFSYLSDWTSAGRWSIAIGTDAGRYDLMPMEGLSFTPKGSVQQQVLMVPYAGDIKCGFIEMIEEWLTPGSTAGRAPFTIGELTAHARVVEQIFGYQ